MKRTLVVSLVIPLGLLAQGVPGEGVMVMRHEARDVVMAAPAMPLGEMPLTVEFLSAEMAMGGKAVKGVPFSAQAVTEVNQALADGNRIQRKSASAIYRDSEGRTRREQTLMGLGALAGPEAMPSMVFINDPVSGANYMLDARMKEARKSTVSHLRTGGPEAHLMEMHEGRGEAGMQTFTKRITVPHSEARTNMGYKTESLGRQIIEGVQADGTRTVMTIPAGQIGNERAIEIVSERWYSPELQTVVMTRNADPRMGETVYKLTGISRAEPPHSLFEIPADYTVK